MCTQVRSGWITLSVVGAMLLILHGGEVSLGAEVRRTWGRVGFVIGLSTDSAATEQVYGPGDSFGVRLLLCDLGPKNWNW